MSLLLPASVAHRIGDEGHPRRYPEALERLALKPIDGRLAALTELTGPIRIYRRVSSRHAAVVFGEPGPDQLIFDFYHEPGVNTEWTTLPPNPEPLDERPWIEIGEDLLGDDINPAKILPE